jgi:hypothetical protein
MKTDPSYYTSMLQFYERYMLEVDRETVIIRS